MAEFKDIFVAIDQIGIVGGDVQPKIDAYTALTGDTVQGGEVAHHPNVRYRGELFNPGPGVKLFFLDMFNIQVEYIEPVDGKSAWQDHVDKCGCGLHHIRFNVSDHEAAIKFMADHGYEVYQSGESVRGGGVKFAYFDTFDKLGFYIETLNLREIELKNQK